MMKITTGAALAVLISGAAAFAQPVQPKIETQLEFSQGCLPQSSFKALVYLREGVRICDEVGFGQLFLDSVRKDALEWVSKADEPTSMRRYRETVIEQAGVTYRLTYVGVRETDEGDWAAIEMIVE